MTCIVWWIHHAADGSGFSSGGPGEHAAPPPDGAVVYTDESEYWSAIDDLLDLDPDMPTGIGPLDKASSEGVKQ